MFQNDCCALIIAIQYLVISFDVQHNFIQQHFCIFFNCWLKICSKTLLYNKFKYIKCVPTGKCVSCIQKKNNIVIGKNSDILQVQAFVWNFISYKYEISNFSISFSIFSCQDEKLRMETRELNSLTLFHRGIHEASNNAKWRESPSAEWEAGVNASRAAPLPTTIKVGWLMVGPTLFVALLSVYRSSLRSTVVPITSSPLL